MWKNLSKVNPFLLHKSLNHKSCLIHCFLNSRYFIFLFKDSLSTSYLWLINNLPGYVLVYRSYFSFRSLYPIVSIWSSNNFLIWDGIKIITFLCHREGICYQISTSIPLSISFNSRLFISYKLIDVSVISLTIIFIRLIILSDFILWASFIFNLLTRYLNIHLGTVNWILIISFIQRHFQFIECGISVDYHFLWSFFNAPELVFLHTL